LIAGLRDVTRGAIGKDRTRMRLFRRSRIALERFRCRVVSREFYGKLLDWQFQDMNMGKSTYTVINVGGQGVGCIAGIPPNAQGMAPAWGGYITVSNVDAVVARVAGLGGRVLLAPTDIPTVGRFATIMDPQGATISLITYAMKN
jgi:predicted enzyme related to lactoylglutathione lyase